MPFFGALMSLGHHGFGSMHYLQSGAVFWSLQRLFGSYYRIVSVYDPKGRGPNHGDRTFLDADIEAFIIRERIILNDVAYVIRQLLPKNGDGARKLKGPSGAVAPANQEMSIVDLITWLERNQVHIDLRELLEQNKKWILELREQRDAVVHYKAKVIVFGSSNEPPQFAFIAAAWDEGDSEKLRPVFEFVNGRMNQLLKFLNQDLVGAIERHAEKSGKKLPASAWPAKMTSVGVNLFLLINEL